MRGLGAESPKTALEEAYKFIVKINPYLLYYGVKTPEQLIQLFESKINGLERELKTYKNESSYSLARRLGISDETLRDYEWVLAKFGDKWRGTLADFLNDSAKYLVMKLREHADRKE
jgi:hypothetical protein